VGWRAVYNATYHLSIAQYLLETYAVKVKCCPKLRQISDIFCPANFKRQCHQKLYPRYHPQPVAW